MSGCRPWRLLALLALVFGLPAAEAAAGCSSYFGKAQLNEYYFGTSANFLEAFSRDSSVDNSAWQGWTITVYGSAGSSTTYTLNNSTANECVFGARRFITYDVPAGLPQQKAFVVLKDASGEEVDALAFDNTNPLDPYDSTPWYTPSCTTLKSAMDSQKPNLASNPSQQNLYLISNYSNKDLARVPDGSGAWTITGLTGANTTYTRCKSNRPIDIYKTVDNSAPTPGQGITFTISVTNNTTKSASVQVTDVLPSGLTYGTPAPSSGSASCSPTPCAAGSTLTWNVTLAQGANATLTLAATVTAAAGSTITNTATVVSPAYTPQPSDSTTLTVAAAPAVGGFNAFETTTASGALTGVIKTKIAGQPFALAIVALNAGKTAVATGFTGDVKVELLDAGDNSGTLDATTGCRSSWTAMPGFSPVTLSFAAADSGRKNVTLSENNAWRDARVRVSYPATGTVTVLGCSGDNFAIRPASFAGISLTDADWQSAGTARTLNNTDLAGTPVHKAGRPFTLRATAVNGQATPAPTTNYTGTATAILSPCASGTACTAAVGTLTVGSGTAVAGVINSTSASYNDVGAFSLQLVDQTFAEVDNKQDDSSTAERYITSAAIDVGRFVPDHFSVDRGTGNAPSLTNRSAAGCSPASTFTYMGEAFALKYRIEARTYSAAVNADGTTGVATPRYTGAWAKGSVSLQAENANAGTDLGARISGASGAWADGVYTVDTTGAKFARNTLPDGAFDSLQLGVTVSDPDGPVLESRDMNPGTSDNCTAGASCTGVGLATTRMRFGRLWLSGTYGSEKLDLPVPLEAQYWNGYGFITNADDNCTAIAAGNLKLGPTSLSTSISISGALSAGRSNLKLAAPNARGTVSVCVDLDSGTGGDTTCQATIPADKTQLQVKRNGSVGYDRDPGALVQFGVYKGPQNVIYQRENY